jgi:hypothetical protein
MMLSSWKLQYFQIRQMVRDEESPLLSEIVPVNQTQNKLLHLY